MRRTSVPSLIALLILGIAMHVHAQSTTATIRGTVKNQSGTAVGGAEVSAVGLATGFVRSVTTGADGSFVLSGITPGEINLVVAAPGFDALSQQVRILLGQNLEMELILSPTAVLSEEITVVGNQLVETETHQAATNVTPAQMEALPQNERNFLNFAALAPGIRVSNDPQRKTIAGDAQPAEQTNIFIDGVSFKNDVLQGGVAGQDSSRGNPFPQNAVQEFRVITQNYSAQYDKASSAIITAVTKSGGNELTGQVFGFYQPKDWVEETEKGFLYSTLTTNADYYRYQYGASIGGPIMKDRLHFFGSYESVDEHATATVNIPSTPFSQQFASHVGEFAKPFRSHLFFGKISWQPGTNQLVDVSANYRTENEVRDFGGTTSYEAATDLQNDVYGATLRHSLTLGSSLNQAALSWQKYSWNPTPLNPGLVGRNFEGVIRVGGASTEQDFDQRRLEFRDDFNFAPMRWWRGTHALQAGGNLDFMSYRVNKSLNGNPQFNFRIDPANNLTFDQPFEAVFGFGNPVLESDNNEYGLYAQDAWTFSDRLTLNLGIRWDYESNMIDNDYVTPPNIVAGLRGKVDDDFFSSGDDRDPYMNAIQPRFGFTYDLSGDGRSVVFGGAGRYYDRLFLNAGLDERYRLQFPVYRVLFTPTGGPLYGGTSVRWDPRYMSLAGLQELVAQGSTRPEIFLLNNNTKPPYSNQFNIGYRRAMGLWVTSISYNGVRGYRGFTWVSATGLCCSALVPGFGNVLISDNGKRYWFDGIYVTVDRPYTNAGWGARVAYTYGSARQNGNDLFSLDYPSASAFPKHSVPGSERHRIVATAILGLPWDVRLSTIISLGSGGATNILDFSEGFSLEQRLRTQPFKNSVYPERSWGFAERNVDLRLEKDFGIGPVRLDVIGEVFNAFNQPVFGCLENFIGPGPNNTKGSNPNLGNANCVTNLARRFQAGVRVNF